MSPLRSSACILVLSLTLNSCTSLPVPPRTSEVVPTDLTPTVTAVDPTDLYCLSLVIYHEARGEPEAGWRAVAQTVLNRLAAPHYPKTLCGVIFQARQFSYIHRLQTIEPVMWARVQQVARLLLQHPLAGANFTATHYYNPTLANPAWADAGEIVAEIGNHRFMIMTIRTPTVTGKTS
jgi:spore germination cell wall hydrolase CwlJ-like protein